MQRKSTTMSGLLARLARSLSSHWKRSLAAAVGVLVLLVLAAGVAGEALDDYSLPGAESQQAIDLFQAHSPAFGGADSTLVFTVDEGKVSDPGAQGGDRGRAREGPRARRRRARGEPVRAGRPGLRGRAAGVGRRALLDRPGEIEKEDGEALIAAGETAEPEVQVEARGYLIDLASEQEAPVGELVGVLIAIVLLDPAVPLRGGDGRDADRRAARRRGGPDSCWPRCRRRSACPPSRP